MNHILFSFLLIIQSAYAQEKKIDCDEVKKNPESLLIYRVKPGEDRTDVLGDQALWRSFKIKVSEKVSSKNSRSKKMMQIRHISLAEQEEILKCFHGQDYKISLIEGNHLETSIPLLDEKDAEKLDKAYTNILQENKDLTLKSKKEIADGLQAVKKINDNQDAGEGLNCLEDIEGIESKTNPIKRKGMVEMFKKVICSTGIVPKIGEPHRWHKDFPKSGIKPPFSKLLVALANGDTNRIMPTGKENDLGAWMIKQETRSVTIHRIFEEAYRLNQGDVYSAFLTIENVLSQNFFMASNTRERFTLTTKLSKIINHVGGEFDLYGPWYHLHGMLLYGYVEENKLLANIRGTIETLNSRFAHEYNDKQEHFMIQGGGVGVRLKKIVRQMSSPEKFNKICKDINKEVNVSDYLNIEGVNDPKNNLEKKIQERLRRE